MPSSHHLCVNTEPRLRVNDLVFVVSGPCVKKVEGVTRLDRVSNEDIRRRLGVEAVLAVADRKKEWRERIEGMSQVRLVRRALRRMCAEGDREDGQERSG